MMPQEATALTVVLLIVGVVLNIFWGVLNTAMHTVFGSQQDVSLLNLIFRSIRNAVTPLKHEIATPENCVFMGIYGQSILDANFKVDNY